MFPLSVISSRVVLAVPVGGCRLDLIAASCHPKKGQPGKAYSIYSSNSSGGGINGVVTLGGVLIPTSARNKKRVSPLINFSINYLHRLVFIKGPVLLGLPRSVLAYYSINSPVELITGVRELLE